MHPRLSRLDDLGRSLAEHGDVVALLGLGSAGTEHDRFDDHSDIDFFVVVDTDRAKARYLHSIDWLAAMGSVAYDFANDVNGRKILFDDGLFVEYAVFTPDELRAIPLCGARIVRQRPGTDLDLTAGGPVRTGPLIDTVEFHLGEALTNLFVGLHRELRGERLTASRFIQVFAIDRVLALARLTDGADRVHRDPFEPTRRVELAHPDLVAPLERMVPGYQHNAAAARAVLAWLTTHFVTDRTITAAIGSLLDEAGTGA